MQYFFGAILIMAALFAIGHLVLGCRHDWKRVNRGTVHSGVNCVGSFSVYQCKKCGETKRETS